MTLIFSNISPISGLLAVSDIITSIEDANDVAPTPIDLPFRKGAVLPAEAGRILARPIQKTVIFGRTLVQFAGNVLYATILIDEIKQKSAFGEIQIDINELIEKSEIRQKILEKVSIIYHYLPSNDPHICRTTINCKDLSGYGFENLWGAGTGEGYFFDNLKILGLDHLSKTDAARSDLIGRALYHAISEAENTDSLYFAYGGWFEMAYREAPGFNKVPYAVKIWGMEDGTLGSGGPAYLGWYSNHNLMISKFQPNEGGGRINMEVDHQIVPDLLRRSPPQPPKSLVQPLFVAHLVYDFDIGTVGVLIDHDPDQHGFILNVSPSGMRHAISEELKQRLRSKDVSKFRSEFVRTWGF